MVLACVTAWLAAVTLKERAKTSRTKLVQAAATDRAMIASRTRLLLGAMERGLIVGSPIEIELQRALHRETDDGSPNNRVAIESKNALVLDQDTGSATTHE